MVPRAAALCQVHSALRAVSILLTSAFILVVVVLKFSPYLFEFSSIAADLLDKASPRFQLLIVNLVLKLLNKIPNKLIACIQNSIMLALTVCSIWLDTHSPLASVSILYMLPAC